jgi:ribose 5-phosphate isomerase B
MIIGIGNDRHAIDIKKNLTKYLTAKGYNVVNYGSDEESYADYCDYAFKVGEDVAHKKIDYGILICNTGIGMSIAANKVKGVRCAKVSDEYEAEMTRRDNNANVLALSAHTDIKKLHKIVDIFLNTEYMNIDRYNRRLEKIDNYDS